MGKLIPFFFLFNPLRDEKDLKYRPFSETYLEKLQHRGVLNIVNTKKKIIAPFSIFVDISAYVTNRHHLFLEQGNKDIESQVNRKIKQQNLLIAQLKI